jgi:hypothetical protein
MVSTAVSVEVDRLVNVTPPTECEAAVNVCPTLRTDTSRLLLPVSPLHITRGNRWMKTLFAVVAGRAAS